MVLEERVSSLDDAYEAWYFHHTMSATLCFFAVTAAVTKDMSYVRWSLSDLRSDKLVVVELHGEAQERWSRVKPGVLVFLRCPVWFAKSTGGRSSMIVEKASQVEILGPCPDIGICQGKYCRSVVNKLASVLCDMCGSQQGRRHAARVGQAPQNLHRGTPRA
jgi:hypothetical protein